MRVQTGLGPGGYILITLPVHTVRRGNNCRLLNLLYSVWGRLGFEEKHPVIARELFI